MNDITEITREMLDELNEREQLVIELIVEGYNKKEVATFLEVERTTVFRMLKAIKQKLAPFKDEFIVLVESIEYFELDLSTAKNEKNTDVKGRAKVLRECAICSNKLFSGENPNKICNKCKEEYGTEAIWVKALIEIESVNFEYVRGYAAFVDCFTDAQLEVDGTLVGN